MMMTFPKDFSLRKTFQVADKAQFPPSVVEALPEDAFEPRDWDTPTPIRIIPTSKSRVQGDRSAGHYFMGGIPALMQAVRALKQDPQAHVTYVNDGQLQKSAQSAHQGHVHPTEWTTPDLGTFDLVKMVLQSLHLLPQPAPTDLDHYNYHHFPLSKIEIPLFLRFFGYRLVHMLLSKNGVSEDDSWQCNAVRASLAFHKALSDEIVAAGGRKTFSYGWRIIWSPNLDALKEKKKLWNELGILAEFMRHDEIIRTTLFKTSAPIYALKVTGDGKFFPHIDQSIINFLQKKHPNSFEMRTAKVHDVYVDETTKQPFAVREERLDGTLQTIAVDSFFGSPGHNRVFDTNKKPLWKEVAVSGVTSLWVCRVPKSELAERLSENELSDDTLIARVRELVGSSNLTNLHLTIWDARIEGDAVYIIARATQGANFNSELADPDDLVNMTANLNQFFIGTWTLVSCGTCIRKTAISNIPEFKENFIHGLSGIGFSFSGAPKEMLSHTPLSVNFLQKLRKRFSL